MDGDARRRRTARHEFHEVATGSDQAHRQGERTWRDAYPDDVDVLVQKQLFNPCELLRVVHPDRPHHGHTLAVEDGFGVSHDEDVPPRQVTPTDVTGFALDVPRLLARWHDTLELKGAIEDLGDGVYVLGERMFDSVHFAIAVMTRQPTTETPLIARRLATSVTCGATIAVLVPTGRRSGTGLADVTLDRIELDGHDVWREVMRVTAVGKHVAAIWRAPRGARLVVDETQMCVWLDRVPIKLAAESSAYKFSRMLAAARNSPVTTDSLEAVLSPSSREENFARKAKSLVKKAIETSMEAVGKTVDVDEIVVSVRGAYKLAVPSYVG